MLCSTSFCASSCPSTLCTSLPPLHFMHSVYSWLPGLGPSARGHSYVNQRQNWVKSSIDCPAKRGGDCAQSQAGNNSHARKKLLENGGKARKWEERWESLSSTRSLLRGKPPAHDRKLGPPPPPPQKISYRKAPSQSGKLIGNTTLQ